MHARFLGDEGGLRRKGTRPWGLGERGPEPAGGEGGAAWRRRPAPAGGARRRTTRARASRSRASVPDPLPQRQRRRLLFSFSSCSSAPSCSPASPIAAPGACTEPGPARCHAARAAELKDGDACPSARPAAPAVVAAAALRPRPGRGPERCRRRPPGCGILSREPGLCSEEASKVPPRCTSLWTMPSVLPGGPPRSLCA